jgi:hypothetical protein
MKKNLASPPGTYTCNDYRQEQILLSLIRRLEDNGLAESEKELLRRHIKKLEADLGME